VVPKWKILVCSRTGYRKVVKKYEHIYSRLRPTGIFRRVVSSKFIAILEVPATLVARAMYLIMPEFPLNVSTKLTIRPSSHVQTCFFFYSLQHNTPIFGYDCPVVFCVDYLFSLCILYKQLISYCYIYEVSLVA
jgi:hypothetical protein